MSQNTSAVSSVVSGTEYHSYSLCDNHGSNCSFNKTAAINFSSVPISLLNSNSTQLRYLKGFAVEGSINQSAGSVSSSVNNISFVFTQEGTNICSIFNTVWNTDGSFGPQLTFYSGSTVINIQNMASKSCSYSNNINNILIKFDGYTHTGSITSFNFVWGDPFTVPSSPVPAITGVCQAGSVSCSSYGGSVSYAGMLYDYTANNDSNAAIIDKIDNLNDTISDHYDKENQAINNIENQTAPSGTDNQQSTNLIGVLSGFISAFSNINATNCSLTLEFPNYAGGTRVVDICQGKEKAPRIVEIGSSLLLIGVFVPLAYILIKMIYNEIRSWTNG